jgi:long-subunit acyl-CoA synthetase (AMP-forming)
MQCKLYILEPVALQDKLIDYLKEIKPTHFLGVPRIWEKFEDHLLKYENQQNGFKRYLRNIPYQYNKLKEIKK